MRSIEGPLVFVYYQISGLISQLYCLRKLLVKLFYIVNLSDLLIKCRMKK